MTNIKVDDELPGFSNLGNEAKQDGKSKKNKKGGGFQAMGFSFPLMKGITKRGYKLPTPIQRKCIPLALEGRDVVGMARTGSGKTACFVLPMLERLSSPEQQPKSSEKAMRGLVLSPTRELALQTLRFYRDLGKFTNLKCAGLVGGDSLEQQFSVLTMDKPDIVIATPGRFLHLCVEMNLQLNNIQMVVFDEADRLFELGFGEQLTEVMNRLPTSRQTLLFSATLPKMLVEFAKAGLNEPMLVRLDVDWKLPSALWLGWISVRSELRTAALLLLLERVLTKESPQAVVFAATKHHVEYLHLVLERSGISSSYAYSGLDPSARKIALGKFVNKKCSVLLVTDVAARGLDLPALDTVINYHFPAKPKLFVHRVGRSARAGRAGRAWSLVTSEDLAHLLDLQLFLSSKIKQPTKEMECGVNCESDVWGCLPKVDLEARQSDLLSWQQSELLESRRISEGGWQQYVKTREVASSASCKRAKTLTPPLSVHPFFGTTFDNMDMVKEIQGYRPTKGTILELTGKNDSAQYLAMKAKRKVHGGVVNKNRATKPSTLEELAEQIGESVKTRKSGRDENYIPHEASDRHTELGYSVNFNAEAKGAELDLGADEKDALRRKTNSMQWDRKRKKLVRNDPDGGRKMIRTESGARVPASFKSGRFNEWQKKNKVDQDDDHNDDDRAQNHTPHNKQGRGKAAEFRPRWVKHNERQSQKKMLSHDKEMKSSQQIVKERMRKDKLKARMKKKTKSKGRKK